MGKARHIKRMGRHVVEVVETMAEPNYRKLTERLGFLLERNPRDQAKPRNARKIAAYRAEIARLKAVPHV